MPHLNGNVTCMNHDLTFYLHSSKQVCGDVKAEHGTQASPPVQILLFFGSFSINNCLRLVLDCQMGTLLRNTKWTPFQ